MPLLTGLIGTPTVGQSVKRSANTSILSKRQMTAQPFTRNLETLPMIERLEASALKQRGWEIAACIAVTPSELEKLCRLARVGLALETAEAARD